MRYFLETYGCQMNKAESAAMEIQLAERSWSRAPSAEEADLVIVNTCSVRITAENRAWGRIAHFAALKRDAAASGRSPSLMVTGCMAERLKDRMLEKAPGIDYVLGTSRRESFYHVLAAIEGGERLPPVEDDAEFSFAPSHMEQGSFTSFLPIMHGCDNFCSYCIVPYVRGREVSRSPESVRAEIAALAAGGVREITLLGQNVNSYDWKGEGGPVGFAGLLRLVADECRARGIGRVRFLSSHPKDLSEETMDVIAGDEVFARHIHLCAQHGSDRILAAMNRRYTASYYLGLVEAIRSRMPDATLSSDILMGFPGETEEDVEATLGLMRAARFAYAYMYHYNPREGTPAASLPGQIPVEVKKERLSRVMDLQKTISRDIMTSMLGGERLVLVESVSKKRPDEVLGRTDQDMMAVFKGGSDLIGTFRRVRLTALRGNTFKAEEAL